MLYWLAWRTIGFSGDTKDLLVEWFLVGVAAAYSEAGVVEVEFCCTVEVGVAVVDRDPLFDKDDAGGGGGG